MSNEVAVVRRCNAMGSQMHACVRNEATHATAISISITSSQRAHRLHTPSTSPGPVMRS